MKRDLVRRAGGHSGHAAQEWGKLALSLTSRNFGRQGRMQAYLQGQYGMPVHGGEQCPSPPAAPAVLDGRGTGGHDAPGGRAQQCGSRLCSAGPDGGGGRDGGPDALQISAAIMEMSRSCEAQGAAQCAVMGLAIW